MWQEEEESCRHWKWIFSVRRGKPSHAALLLLFCMPAEKGRWYSAIILYTCILKTGFQTACFAIWDAVWVVGCCKYCKLWCCLVLNCWIFHEWYCAVNHQEKHTFDLLIYLIQFVSCLPLQVGPGWVITTSGTIKNTFRKITVLNQQHPGSEHFKQNS